MIRLFLLVALAPGCGPRTEAGDSASDSAADPPGCPDYTGFARVGATWSYEIEQPHHNGWSGEWTAEITSHDGWYVTVEQVGWMKTSQQYEEWLRQDYYCDEDGLWLLFYRHEFENSAGDYWWGEVTYEAPGLLWVASSLEERWTSTASMTGVNSSGDRRTETVEHDVTPQYEKEITVPAGTFEVVGLEIGAFTPGGYKFEVHRDVGTITTYDELRVLTAYEP